MNRADVLYQIKLRVGGVFLLRQIKFKNYRCFEESEISFRNTAIIVGQNNAGKSTIVEALRILSVVAQKFKQSNYLEVPRGLGLPLATRGIKVNLDNLKIDFRSIVYQYREEDGVVAELIAYFDEKIRIHIYLSSEISFATIEASGQQIKNKAAAKKLPDIPLYIMPQIGLIREDEKRLSPDTVKAHMHTRLSSRHFRNELLLYREYFEEFRESAQMSWPGLRITNLDIDEERIELIVYDADFAAEIGQMGSGLQMWLQMVWYISRCPIGSTIVLDEPDVYMHPDLQQKIFKIVQRKFRQVIIATHSVEIISLVEPKQIVTVDKRSRKMQYADSYQAVQDLVDNLGGMNNLSLIRLGGARKCVFVEGKDLKLLSKFHELLYPDSNISLEQLPTVSLGGWSRFDEALGAARLFYDQTNGEFKTICILDRDYHFDEEIAELYRKAEENHLNLHVWEKKEIENYILTPQSIFRLIEQPQETYPIFLECLSTELEQLKQQTLGGFMDQLDRNCRGQASSRKYQIATAELEKRWGTLEDRLSVCNGKDLISHINSWVARQYHQKSSRKKLLDSLTAEDVCDEMKQVISDLIEK